MPTIWSRSGDYYTDTSPPSVTSSVTDEDERSPAAGHLINLQTPSSTLHDSEASSGFDMVDEAPLGLEAQNGTLLAEAASCANSPKKAADLARHVAEKELTVKKMRTAVSSAASSVADGIATGFNKAMEGRDAVEILNSATDLVNSFPKIWRFQQGNSAKPPPIIAERRNSSSPSLYHLGAHSTRHHFVTFMAPKARLALSERGIMTPEKVAGLEFGVFRWQIEQALGELYDQSQEMFDGDSLVEMEPSWIPDPEQKVWHLVLDTGINTEMSADPWILETGVELLERLGKASIADYGRAKHSQDEDEWEDVEELMAEDEMEEMDQIGTLKAAMAAQIEKEKGITESERNSAKTRVAPKKAESCRDSFFGVKVPKFWSVR